MFLAPSFFWEGPWYIQYPSLLIFDHAAKFHGDRLMELEDLEGRRKNISSRTQPSNYWIHCSIKCIELVSEVVSYVHVADLVKLSFFWICYFGTALRLKCNDELLYFKTCTL